ncbi:MAG TPA: PEP/pyruvate-binding domain-containing protein, partial [Anaerolineae bacterium]|nr:PEP/pyruvate-binding domain-containing protein [Anaerolineae bacterium]
MTDTIQAFASLRAQQQPSAGGKGGTLARLYQAGYPVPDGFVILPTAFANDELSSEGRSTDVLSSERKAGDLLSADAWTQIQAHLARLRRSDPQVSFAVRSSALAEDSAHASYAGEFETILGVRTDRAVRAAIHTVRKSRHSQRVQAYSQARGLGVDHEMAVVVQHLVPATISGVLFTADPVGGSRTKMVGNYVYGSGQELVSGEVRPYSFSLTRPKGKYNGPRELRTFARRLFKLAMRLERELHGPQDIEWAIAGKKVYVLQSRPITTLVGFDPVTGEFNDSLAGDYVWSCVNIGEAMSIVMTPFTWSIVRRAFDELNILPGHTSAGNIGGRAYQNVTVMISMFRALGRKFDDLSQEMGGVREEYLETMDQYLSPLPDATFLKVLPNAIRMQRKQRQGMKGLDDFVIDNPAWCQITRHRIQAATEGDELISLWADEQMPRSLAWF